MTRWIVALTLCAWFAGPAAAQEDRRIVLQSAPELQASGLLKYILTRFSLKTQIRLEIVPSEAAVAAAGVDVVLAATPEIAVPEGAPRARPVLRAAGGGTLYHVRSVHPPEATSARAKRTRRFIDWLGSDIGQRTIEAFAPDGSALYAAAAGPLEVADAVEFSGDIVAGEKLSLAHCGRCHVVNETNRMNSLGSTPSFAGLRALGNWQARFSAFYTLNPHPSFTQVAEVTAAFDPARPPPIVPIELTLDDLDAILAFVASIQPADLGAPVRAN